MNPITPEQIDRAVAEAFRIVLARYYGDRA